MESRSLHYNLCSVVAEPYCRAGLVSMELKMYRRVNKDGLRRWLRCLGLFGWDS